MLASSDRLRSWALAHDDPTPYTPPDTFGPFRVLHQVGVGVLGPVFRAYDPARDRLVAVKAFRLDLPPDQVRVFLTELQGLCEIGLDHPGLAAPIAAGIEGGAVYLVCEYVASDSLDVAFRVRATASLERVGTVIAQLGDALDYARARGVGHGALHPRDIFVGPDRACATGFGIVQALERAEVHPPVRRPYAAPERVAGASWSTAADVFSLAVIAHEWLTGKRPGGRPRAVPLVGWPDPARADLLQEVMARALAEDPDVRYRTGRAFTAALEAVSSAAVEAEPGEEVPYPSAEVDFDLRIEESPGRAEVAAPLEAVDLVLQMDLAPEPVRAGGAPASLLDLAEGEEAREQARAQGAEGEQQDEQAREEEATSEGGGEAEERSEEGEEEEAEERGEPGGEEEAVGHVAPAGGMVAAVAEAIAGEQADEAGAVRAVVAEAVEEAASEEQELVMGEPSKSAEARSRRDTETFGRPRVAVLPYAVVLTVGVLAGFLVGYALGSRERGGAERVEQPSTGSRGSTVGPSETRPGQPFTEAPLPSAGPTAVGAAAPGAPVPGRLVIRSTPAAATVRIDGVARGTTPLAVDGLALGTYRVEVSRRGYASVVREVTLTTPVPSRELVVQLQSAAVTGQAPRAARSGAAAGGVLVAVSRPPGARVVLDRRVVGRTPLTLRGVKPGRHVVRLELDGYRGWTTEVVVSNGRETRVAGSLDRVRNR